jgi:hypothetical protein
MSAVVTLVGYRVLAGEPARGATPRRRAPVPAAAAAATPAPSTAPTRPMPAVARPVTATAAGDEPVTTVAPAGGYRPLWARNPSPPPT